jgi:hypothetical protein
MSNRSSLHKFRPVLERCEARDLAAAGLAGAAAGVHTNAAVHIVDADNLAFTKVRNLSGTNLWVKWTVEGWNATTHKFETVFTKTEQLALQKSTSNPYKLDRYYQSVEPKFYVEFDPTGKNTGVGKVEQLLNGRTYHFVTKPGTIEIELKPAI